MENKLKKFVNFSTKLLFVLTIIIFLYGFFLIPTKEFTGFQICNMSKMNTTYFDTEKKKLGCINYMGEKFYE